MLKISGDGRRAALDMRLVAGERTARRVQARARRDRRSPRIWRENRDRHLPRPRHRGARRRRPGRCRSCSATSRPRASAWNAYDELRALLAAHGVPGAAGAVRPRSPQRRREGPAVRGVPRGARRGADRLDGEDGRRHQHPAARDRAAPSRLPVAARGHRAARGPHPAAGQPEPGGRDLPLRRRAQSFDAYSWQTVERKAKFIAQVTRGRLDVRAIEDIGDQALSYTEVKALASGDPLILDHARVSPTRSPAWSGWSAPGSRTASSCATRSRRLSNARKPARRTLRRSSRRSPAEWTPAATCSR